MPQIGDVCQPMAAGVWSLRSHLVREVCMCRFGTHTLAGSMSLADMEGHSPIVHWSP